MLALAEILALIILNALVHAAFTRWKIARRTQRRQRQRTPVTATPYPLHPSPAGYIRPAGIDW